MQTSTKAALGAGAAILVGSLVGQGLAVARTAQAMNAQIDADCAFLAQHCYLPDVPPALPLSVPSPRSKGGIFVRCWALGSAGIFLLILLGSLVFGLAANDPSQQLAMNVVGGGMVGLFAGVLGGWLPTSSSSRSSRHARTRAALHLWSSKSSVPTGASGPTTRRTCAPA